MDKEIMQIRTSMAQVRCDVSRAREGLRNVRDSISVCREWMTNMRTINASMVLRMQQAKERNEACKASIKRFYAIPTINVNARETVQRLIRQMLLSQCEISIKGNGDLNLARPIERGDLFPAYYYEETALIRRNN
jgi:hypothetical protein